MATEIEMKLSVPDQKTLEQVLSDPEILQYTKDDYVVRHMTSTYYDTPDNQLHQRRWSLRLRDEGGQKIAAMKTANMSDGAGFFTRNEWQCVAESIEDAIPMLIDQGAPRELKAIAKANQLVARCGAEFDRKSVCLYLDEGVRIEMAADYGTLFGNGQEAPICELELELLYGDAASLVPLCDQLRAVYGLSEERRSKCQRARALTLPKE